MPTLEKINMKQRLNMRPYQELIVSDIISKFNINKPYVLGSCPSSGKTEMAIETIIRLIELGLVNRVLILAHSTNVLKENFYERLTQYFNKEDIDIMRGQRRYNHDAIIQVMIPQNTTIIDGEIFVMNKKVDKFDLVITDEAHHNVLAEDGKYSQLIDIIKPKFQLLLTGTPSKFILQNNYIERENEDLARQNKELLELPYHINTIGMDRIGFDNFHDVRFDLIRSAYGFTNADYNNSHNLPEETKFSLADTERTINNVIIGAVRNIALRNGTTLSKNADCIKEGRKLIQEGKFGKTLIMCRNIQQATQISDIIAKLFKTEVMVSESKNDIDSENLEKFKNNEFNFLCVVNRAREGFDDKKIVNLIDITLTHNIDLIYQMFCRVVRKDDTYLSTKLYLKVTSNAEGMPEYTMNIMTASLMLGATENLSIFNGRNFRGIGIPAIPPIDDDGNGDNVVVDGDISVTHPDGRVTRRSLNSLLVMDLVRIFSDDHENLINGNDRYAMTTLGESLDILNGILPLCDDKKIYFDIVRKHKINGANDWSSLYREISINEQINLRYEPWRFFNQTIKEFFDECYPERCNYCLDKTIYFNLLKREKITYSTPWLEHYKELSNRDSVLYYSNPWLLFNQTPHEFFLECFPENTFYKDKDGYMELFKKNKITNSIQWGKLYLKLSKIDNTKFHSNPWRLFNQTEKDWFNECYPGYIICENKELYFKVCVENNIVGPTTWYNSFKLLREQYKTHFHSAPWGLFNQTQKEFFDECYPKKEKFYTDKEGYFILFRKHNITNKHHWNNMYSSLPKNNGIKYHSNPWNLFKQTEKEFFDECYPNRAHYSSKTGYFKMFRKYDINNPKQLMDKHKRLSVNDNVKYHSKPWSMFKQTDKQFFDEYRQWLLENPKKEFSPEQLSFIQKINQMGKTTSAKNMNKFFDDNPNEFKKYHEIRSENSEYWNEDPCEEIAKKITDKNDVVIDFGCGVNKLKTEIPNNKVTGIDHIAIDDSVIACDMSDLSKCVSDESHDVAVFSLSLWGTQKDKESYLREAYRVLKRKGIVYIADTTGDGEKVEEKKDGLVGLLSQSGFELIDNVDIREKFMYITGIKI